MNLVSKGAVSSRWDERKKQLLKTARKAQTDVYTEKDNIHAPLRVVCMDI
jgi:hypothetical protein